MISFKEIVNVNHIKNLEDKSQQLKRALVEIDNTRQRSYEERVTAENKVKQWASKFEKLKSDQEKFEKESQENLKDKAKLEKTM